MHFNIRKLKSCNHFFKKKIHEWKTIPNYSNRHRPVPSIKSTSRTWFNKCNWPSRLGYLIIFHDQIKSAKKEKKRCKIVCRFMFTYNNVPLSSQISSRATKCLQGGNRIDLEGRNLSSLSSAIYSINNKISQRTHWIVLCRSFGTLGGECFRDRFKEFPSWTIQ